MFKTNNSTENVLRMARMVFPEATVIAMESGPQLVVTFRARGYAINTLIAIEVTDMTAALQKVGIHPLSYMAQVRSYAIAQLSDFDSRGN
jgi:hypothetical protein